MCFSYHHHYYYYYVHDAAVAVTPTAVSATATTYDDHLVGPPPKNSAIKHNQTTKFADKKMVLFCLFFFHAGWGLVTFGKREKREYGQVCGVAYPGGC